jgi:hypothetical protein
VSFPAGEGDLGRLDSSIKKNGAFIKKLRALAADNRQQLLAEAAKLNLSKVRNGYEVVDSVQHMQITYLLPAIVGMQRAPKHVSRFISVFSQRQSSST